MKTNGDYQINLILKIHPETADIFEKQGLCSNNCNENRFETLEEISESKGLDLKKFIKKLGEKCS